MHLVKFLVLVADSDIQNRKISINSLIGHDFKFVESSTAKETIRLAGSIKPDLILIDLDFSDQNGIEVIRKIREFNYETSILALSNKVDDQVVLDSFLSGADDFLAKPLHPGILLARSKALVRRKILRESESTTLAIKHLLLNQLKHELKVNGRVVSLSPKEYKLLTYMMTNSGKMLTHQQILNKVWGPSHSYNTQYLRVYIAQLRKKIDADERNSIIKTEAGIGYRMEG